MQSDTDEADVPKNKGGRPKGRRNRPKWLLKELKDKPKLPRGRPKGSPNKVKTLEGWLEQQLLVNPRDGPKPPAPPEKPKKLVPSNFKSRPPPTPEEMARRHEKARITRRKRGTHTGPAGGQPRGWTRKDFTRFLVEAEKEGRRIFKIMDKQGSTPENDMAKVALQSAFEMIAQPLPPKDRLAAVRTVLEYTKQKPATQSNVTVKSAEDFLDELAEFDDSNESGAEEAPNT